MFINKYLLLLQYQFLKPTIIMEIRITNNQILKILLIVSWIIFLGVCIEAGSFLFNILYTMIINPGNSSYLNLSELYAYDH